MNSKTYLLQVGLKSLGFNPGAIDGVEGPQTLSAVAAFEASRRDIPATAAIFGTMLVARAKTQLHIREITKNQAPGIEKFWSATSYPDGMQNREPYCAAFVCWLVRETAALITKRKWSLPKSPVAYDFEKWALDNTGKGVLCILPDGAKPQPGDIFTLATASHVGVVESWDGLESFKSIEANTDGSGSREGDGVYSRSRKISHVRRFIRILA